MMQLQQGFATRVMGLRDQVARQQFCVADVAEGSPTDIPRCLRHVRSAPNNGLKSDVAALRIWAIKRLMQCNKSDAETFTDPGVGACYRP
jgi:hypothetical protein